MITEGQIIIRLLVAAALGLIIGFERERQDHSAGLRTHMILVTGAALAMTISINVAFIVGIENRAGDPARLAAQVVSGIGFLGAGVIFRYGTNVRGLTTAASLWTVTIVGLAVGAGLFLAAVTATILILLFLTLLNYFEDHLTFSYNRVHMSLQASFRPGLIEEIQAYLKQGKRKLGPLTIDRDIAGEKVTLESLVRLQPKDKAEQVIEELAKIKGVNQVKITE